HRAELLQKSGFDKTRRKHRTSIAQTCPGRSTRDRRASGASGMTSAWSILIATSAVLLLSACGGEPKPRTAPAEEWHPAVAMLEKYADRNGVVTHAAMEAGLKADFAAADANHDRCLDQDEARAINEARWKEDASATSPL